MKVYIQTDIEGVAGFVFYENRKDTSVENHAHRQRMRTLLTHEVNAAVEAAFDLKAKSVLVNDNHGSGYNIIFEELDARCEIIHGRNCSGAHWLPDLDGSDAMVLVGMHAMGGTHGALLSHSLWTVNNGKIFLSEGSMAAALAGCRGIPTVFASGDQYITAELAEKIPGIEIAQVKKALGTYLARSVMPQRSDELIYQGVKAGLKKRDKIAPYVIPGPLKLNLLESAGHIPPFKNVLKKDVTGKDMDEAFLKALTAFSWNKMNVNQPDGFVYP